MIAVALEPERRRGRLRVAAIARRSVHCRSLGRMLAGTADKTPLVILIDDGATVRAADLSGAPVAREAVDRLCPGAWARFAARR